MLPDKARSFSFAIVLPICAAFFCLLGLLSWLTALAQGTGCVLVAVGHTHFIYSLLPDRASFLHSWSASEVNNTLNKSDLYLVREHAETQGSGFASRTLQEERNRNDNGLLQLSLIPIAEIYTF